MTTRSFVGLTICFSVIALAVVYVVAPMDAWMVNTLGTLALLALMADLIGFLLPRGASGSISFIPYISTVLLVPNASAVLAICTVHAIGDVARKRKLEKVLFNTAQIVIAYSAGVLVYTWLGGVSLFQLTGLSVADATLRVGVPLSVAYVVIFAINTLLVCRVVGLETRAKTLQVWRENASDTIGLDVLALPLVFAFAWVYANYGTLFASLLWMPILGLRQLNTTNLELAQTNRELLELMIKSIEARDLYTSGHSRRVKEYAASIARLIGLPLREIDKIATAALLHDVGKIYDKYAPILAKNDRLTPEEWAIIKEHPQDGANLIATMTRLRELVPAVRHHHENWDGTGYPDGLRGEDIPLASRIIMFADTIDAMTTERPYRGTLDESEVRQEIIRCRGRQFDPVLADKLLSGDFWATMFPPTVRRTGDSRLRLLTQATQRIAN